MIGTDLVIKRSTLGGGAGERFFAPHAPRAPRAAIVVPSLVANLLSQVGTIPTGFGGSGEAVFSLGNGPSFGGDDNTRAGVACVLRGLLG